jgi:hypothetical protein
MDITFSEFPGEKILTDCLQKPLHFYLHNRCIRSGKLLLYKPVGFSWCLTLGLMGPAATPYDSVNFEVPMPLKIESYPAEGLFYFDYRLLNAPQVYHPAPSCKLYEYVPLGDRKSIFYNSILECKLA